jgi:hypothetical protein
MGHSLSLREGSKGLSLLARISPAPGDIRPFEMRIRAPAGEKRHPAGFKRLLRR